jgi:DNA-binding response OmpR family regulator
VNTVWVYLSNLRKKLATLDAGAEIRVMRGVGYYIAEKDRKVYHG